MKTGRNAQCPCGSGRKYKKCHGLAAAHGSEHRIEITVSDGSGTPGNEGPRGTISGPGKVPFGALAATKAFDRLMEDINGELREEGVAIPDRPAAAVQAAARILRQELTFEIEDREPRHGVYHGDDLVTRIVRWYRQHYDGALEPAVRINSEEDFQRYSEEIDRTLKERGIPIPGRPIAAVGEFSRLLRMELALCALDRDPVPGRYIGNDLSIRIARWYDERYGDRLLMSGKLGEVVVLLRGDPWILELPLTYGGGGLRFVCEYGRRSTLPTTPQVYRIGDPRPPDSEYNVLDAVKGLPDGLAATLQDDECNEILAVFLLGWEALEALRFSKGLGRMESIRGNLEAAVIHIVGNHRQTGLSKWESLQAAEKLLKAYIDARHGTYKFSHNLDGLAKNAIDLELPPVDDAWIRECQCPAGVRYGEVPVTLQEAVAAHHASLRFVAHVLGALNSESNAA